LLHVGREGRLDGDVSAMSVVVEGQVRGKLWAGERVELREGARCEGEIRTVVLVAAPGAIFNGPVSVGAGGAEMPQAASSIRPGERRL
jgi:cytoskeletal protein CcmA (bactofilin family)